AHAEAANTALLRPLAATADSIGSAIGAFWDQLVNLFNAAAGQLKFFLQIITWPFIAIFGLTILGGLFLGYWLQLLFPPLGPPFVAALSDLYNIYKFLSLILYS